MRNDEIMKLILSPSSNMIAFANLIEQQERMAKSISPALIMNDSILKIAQYYDNLNKINKSIQIPYTISDTISSLLKQTSEITSKYSKYYNQLNDVIKTLHPSLSVFFKNNSSLTFDDHNYLNDIDLGIVNSFDSVDEDFDETTQSELNLINKAFESQQEFKEEVSELINESTPEITTDIYLRFSQIIEKYVGVNNARTIALFLSLILTTYFILIPLYQNYLSNESEIRQTIQIENVEEEIKSEIENSNTMLEDKMESFENETKDLHNSIEDKFKVTEVQFDKLNDKLDEIINKLDDSKK